MSTPEFSLTPSGRIRSGTSEIVCFLTGQEFQNIDWPTVKSFGEEWNAYSQFSDAEIHQVGSDYFDIVPPALLTSSTLVLDVGCGSGRWTKFLAAKVGRIEAIDPSDSVVTAANLLRDLPNARVSRATVEGIPFHDKTFDLVVSLGVLHHVPDTRQAIKSCVAKIKPGGHFLVYLYYNLDNRGPFHRLLFGLVNAIRGWTSRFSGRLKRQICDVLAFFIYLPLATLARIVEHFFGDGPWVRSIPLSYYRDKTLYIMRNDCLDRFGTPMEHRFSRLEIETMLVDAGLEEIIFSPNEPYWHALGRRKQHVR